MRNAMLFCNLSSRCTRVQAVLTTVETACCFYWFWSSRFGLSLTLALQSRHSLLCFTSREANWQLGGWTAWVVNRQQNWLTAGRLHCICVSGFSLSLKLQIIQFTLWFASQRENCLDKRIGWLQVAFIGFVVQALVTRSNGPIEDLQNHLANPFGNNIITNVANLPQTLSRR